MRIIKIFLEISRFLGKNMKIYSQYRLTSAKILSVCACLTIMECLPSTKKKIA